MSSSIQYRWWRDTPRFARRFYWRTLLATLVAAAIMLAVSLMAAVGWMGAVPMLALFSVLSFVPGAIVGFYGVVVRRWETRLLERLGAAGCQLCPRCGFDFTSHDGPTNCSECGTALDLEEVKKVWQAFRPLMTRVPRMVLRRRLVIAISAFVLWPAMVIPVTFQVSRGPRAVLGWMLAAIGAMLAFGAWHLMRERRLRKAALEHDGYLCPQCAYPLPREEKEVRCPECGTNVDVQQVVAQWCEFAALTRER